MIDAEYYYLSSINKLIFWDEALTILAENPRINARIRVRQVRCLGAKFKEVSYDLESGCPCRAGVSNLFSPGATSALQLPSKGQV